MAGEMRVGGLEILESKIHAIAEQNIRSDEEVDFCLVGVWDQSLIALPERILIIKQGMMAGVTFGSRVTSLLYRDITGIEITQSWGLGVIEFTTPSYTDAFKTSEAREKGNTISIQTPKVGIFQPYLEDIRLRVENARKPIVSPSGPGGIGTELEKLATLRGQGVLTDQEFEQAKRRLLG